MVRFLAQEKVHGRGWFVTFERRRWYWPWSWKRLSIFTSTEYPYTWTYEDTGKRVDSETRCLLDAQIRAHLAREAQLENLLNDTPEPPRLVKKGSA